MNPQAIVVVGAEDAPIGWVCGACSTIWIEKNFPNDSREYAEKCCNLKCEDCGGKPAGAGWVCCATCIKKRSAERDQRSFEKAEKIDTKDYSGKFIYLPELEDEGYIPVDDLEEKLDEFDDHDRPTWGFACVPEHASCVLDSLLDDVLSDHHEDAIDLVDRVALTKAQRLVDAALKDVVTYREDRSQVVIFPERDLAPLCVSCGHASPHTNYGYCVYRDETHRCTCDALRLAQETP